MATTLKYLVIALILSGASVAADAQEKPVSSRVQDELAQVRTYDGESLADALIAIGPEAVPVLCQQLEIFAFPMEIINVLAEFQDPRAVPALLSFLDTRREEWKEAGSVCVHAVRALKEIADPRAEQLLLGIASNHSSHIGLRFNATSALARLGSPAVKKQAWNELAELCRTKENVSENAHPDLNVILFQDFYLGLCEVRTDEVDEELASFLVGNSPGYQKAPVINLLARRKETLTRKKVVDALLNVAEHEFVKDDQGDELHTMALAFKALVALHAVPLETLLKIAQTWERAIEAEQAAFGKDETFIIKYANELRKLKAEVQEAVFALQKQSERASDDLRRGAILVCTISAAFT